MDVMEDLTRSIRHSLRYVAISILWIGSMIVISMNPDELINNLAGIMLFVSSLAFVAQLLLSANEFFTNTKLP